jgi:AI-2 transport protein TqsA
MSEPVPSVAGRLLKSAAYIVVVAWGIRTASHILYLILIALLFAYVFLPFPKWLMHRFRLRQSLAIALTAVLWAGIWFAVSFALFEAGHRLMAKLPIYEERIRILHERVVVFLSAHGIQSTHNSVNNMYSYDRIVEFARAMLPMLIGFFSDRVLIFLLGLGFLMEMTYLDSSKSSLFARKLVYYGTDVQRFIAICAQAGAIIALANLALLAVLGVDAAIIWCLLYFFLQFIPNIGFVLALVPPSLMALVMLGWKRALLVAGGLIVTQLVGDYVVKPMLMKKGLNISFLEIMLSLVVWGFLLGAAGAILAIPLTLALRRAIEMPFAEWEGTLGAGAGLNRGQQAVRVSGP